MPLMEGQILDIGSTGFAHPEPIEPEQHRQSRVALVAALCCEQEGTQLPTIEASTLRWMDLRTPDVLGWVGAHPSVDVGEPVEAAHGRQPAVDRGRSKAPLFHGRSVELDVRPLRLQHGETDVGGPLQEAPEVEAMRIERSSVVASEEGGGRHLRFIETGVLDDDGQ